MKMLRSNLALAKDGFGPQGHIRLLISQQYF